MVDFYIIIKNYFFIQLSVLSFFAPFYLLYRYKHQKSGAIKLSFNEHLEYFFGSKEANLLIFAWAALEAIVWFVIPEFLLLLIVFLRIRKKIQLLLYDIYGTIVGTIIAIVIPLHSNNDILKIPYLQSNMIAQTEVWYQSMGIFGLISQPFSGIPYKVFTLTIDRFEFFLPMFIILAVFVRVSRYYFFYLIFSGIYPFLHKFVYRNYIPLFIVACFIFTVGFLRVYNLYDNEYKIDYSFMDKIDQLKNLVLH